MATEQPSTARGEIYSPGDGNNTPQQPCEKSSAATCPTCGHSTAHTHEWEAAGQVEMPYTMHSPVSRNDDYHGTKVYIIQSCKCGSTRHKLVAEK